MKQSATDYHTAWGAVPGLAALDSRVAAIEAAALVVVGPPPAALTGARQLTASGGLQLVDGGAGSTVDINGGS